ncbi:MAG: glycogen debranching N-terminal domain-containing protein [Trueperaceae bacterium]
MSTPFALRAHNHPEIHYAWRGPSVLVTDNQGRCGQEELTGYFFRETRYLHELRLQIDEEDPFPCSVAEVAPNALEFAQIYPPVESRGGGGSGSGGSGRHHGILFRGLDLDLRYHVHPATLEVRLRITNRWDERAEFDLGWLLSADFAGTSEAQAGKRQQEAPVAIDPEEGGVRFRYTHEKLPLETHVTVDGPGAWSFTDGRLSTRVTLDRQEGAEVRLHVRAVDAQDPLDDVASAQREQRLHAWHQNVTRLAAPGDTPLVEITNQAMHDLGSMALLDGEQEQWLAPAAGIPLYPAVFGRDALTAAWQAAVFDGGELVRATLAKLRPTQGSVIDDWRDEEPGRIIQQARRDPTARLGKTPFDRYYGDHASPLMFLIGLGQLYAWSGRKQDLEENWDAARRILEWTRRYGDTDGDGYLDYLTRSPKGPKHQGWKDSDNSMVYGDGSQVQPPIAPCEIQGYWYAALQFMSALSLVMGDHAHARDLWREAGELKERFNRDFWLPDEGYVALGLDADKQPIRSLTSNAAQCIATGIVANEHLPRLVERLFQPDLFSRWGLRTLSTGNPAYNPLSYHLGSVWAVENGTILFGLRRYGFDQEATTLARSLYDLARIWEANRIPECVGGYAREERSHPGAYPRANAPQAWNRSTFAILMQSLLGMRPVATMGLLAIDPVLPEWLPEVTLQRLRVGEGSVDLRFWRDRKGESHHEVLSQEGSLRIVRQPPVQGLSVGPWDRLAALVEGVLPFG